MNWRAVEQKHLRVSGRQACLRRSPDHAADKGSTKLALNMEKHGGEARRAKGGGSRLRQQLESTNTDDRGGYPNPSVIEESMDGREPEIV